MPEAGYPVRPAYLAYQMIWLLLDGLFPPVCAGCGAKGRRWCDACQAGVCRLPKRICPQCGEPHSSAHICRRCQETQPGYLALRSYAEFGGSIREALHHLKYRRDIGLGEALCHPLIDYCRELGWQIDLTVPIPLGRARMKERGYNQADLLAHPLALAMGTKYSTNAVRRERETATQVGLGVVERLDNVAGAFIAQQSQVAGRRILVIDDVATTGATISACAGALLQAGAAGVYGLTLARAVMHAKQEKIDLIQI
jgi:competence protein ComFC